MPQEKDNLQKIRLQELRQEIQLGLDSGHLTELNMQEIKQKARQGRQKKAEFIMAKVVKRPCADYVHS